jgi:hypothetical protein
MEGTMPMDLGATTSTSRRRVPYTRLATWHHQTSTTLACGGSASVRSPSHLDARHGKDVWHHFYNELTLEQREDPIWDPKNKI